MNKTLLKMALLTSIITPSVMASADDSRQILAFLQQMQTSLTQLHNKVDTLETRLNTLEQEKSSALPKTQQPLATEPTKQALSSSIADDTTSNFEEKANSIFGEIQQTYPWFGTCYYPIMYQLTFGNPQIRQKIFSLLNKIKEAGTDKIQLQNIRSQMKEGGDLYINEAVTDALGRSLNVILSPNPELLQRVLSYDNNLFDKDLCSYSLHPENLSDLEEAIQSKLIQIDRILLSDYDEEIPGVEEMLMGLMRGGSFNEVKAIHIISPYLNNLRDLATDMISQGKFKNIQHVHIYCDNLDKAKEIVRNVIAAKKAGKLNRLEYLRFNYQLEDASKSDPESQELRNGLKQLGIYTNLANPWL